MTTPDTTDHRRWYFRIGARMSGPYTQAQLVALFTEGKVAADLKIFLSGREHEAKRLSQVYQLPKDVHPKAENVHLGVDGMPARASVGSASNEMDFEHRAVPVPSADQQDPIDERVFSTKENVTVRAYPPGSFSLALLHPWRRAVARIVDVMVISSLVTPLLKNFTLVSEGSPKTHVSTLSLMYLAATWIVVLVNAYSLTRFGATPGKWLLGIRVVDSKRDLLIFPRALLRELGVLIIGFSGGLLAFSPLTLVFTILFFKAKGVTPWDRIASAALEFESISLIRLVLMLPLLLVVLGVWQVVVGVFLS